MTVSELFQKYDFSATFDVDALLAEFDRQMDEGLAGRPSSLAMIPAYIDSGKPVPVDEPIIVLDAGGTNLRVAVVWFDKAGKARVEDFHKYAMPATDGKQLGAEEFFETFAGFLEPVCQRAEAVGFCFSYPTEILPDLDGRLIRWTKQVDAPEVVGQLVGSRIAEALEKKTGRKLSLRVLNDTVATLLAGMSAGISRRYSSYVGFILGTGTNIAYIEKNGRIGKVAGLPASGSMIINEESGGFAGFRRSKFDEIAVEGLKGKDEGIFEKMIAGVYMGTLGLTVLQCAARDGFFSKPVADGILGWTSLTTIDFDNFVANPYVAKGAFSELPLTDEDRRAIQALGEPLFVRAANLTAVNIASAVLRCGEGHDPLHPVCVTIDGSTYYKTRSCMFRSRVEQGLREILGKRGVYFDTICVEDAPLIGSAIAGLIA